MKSFQELSGSDSYKKLSTADKIKQLEGRQPALDKEVQAVNNRKSAVKALKKEASDMKPVMSDGEKKYKLKGLGKV